MKVYVAGPYSADTSNEREDNTRSAIFYGVRLKEKGHSPFIPHLLHYVDQQYPMRFSCEDYAEWDDAFLKICDGFLYTGASRGSDRELQIAKDMDMRIFYGIDEVPNSE